MDIEYMNMIGPAVLGGGILVAGYALYSGIVKGPKRAVTRAQENYSADMSFNQAREEYLRFIHETEFAMSFRKRNEREKAVDDLYLPIINQEIHPDLQRCIDVGATTLETVLNNWNEIDGE